MMGRVAHVLEYVDEGTGIPVVFSHGGSSDVRYWEPQREAFAARYRFVTYSRRVATVDEHVSELVAVMRRLNAGPVHLVGFSTAFALRATLLEPSLVRSLTVVEPNVPWLLEGDPEGEAALAWWRTETERVRSEAAGDAGREARLWFELVDNRGPGTFDDQHDAFRRMWLENFGATRPTSPPPEPLTCAQLAELTPPTLVVAAEHGMPYSRRIADVLARCVPRSRLVVVPAVTHFMSYQEPEAFNEVVLDFVAAH
jgi:non-heme chloroperoxidase